MTDPTLDQAVFHLAAQTESFSDADLEQPWAWRAHDEGVRFTLIGSYHELRDLAVELATRRSEQGPPVSRAQRALAQVHAAYRDLQAVLLGVDDALYNKEPAPGEWPLRIVVGHIAAAERHFFTLVHYGLARQRDGRNRSPRLPEGQTDTVTGSYDQFRDLMENGRMADMLAFYDERHRLALEQFAAIGDDELAGPTVWWEGEELSLQYRLHRFDAHLRQHTIQAEKTLVALDHLPNEARQLLRLVYNALAEVEGALIGAPELGAGRRRELAAAIAARADDAAEWVSQTREMGTAVQSGDMERVKRLLDDTPRLADARDPDGISLVLAALYRRRRPLAEMLAGRKTELNIFEGAALGRLDVVQRHLDDRPRWRDERAGDGFTPLLLACFFGHEPVARWLVEQGADVNAPAGNATAVAPLHAAAAGGNRAIVALLLEAGADPNQQQASGDTPLHQAAAVGDEAMTRLLLRHGADPHLARQDGRAPIDLAQEQGHENVVALLGGDQANR